MTDPRPALTFAQRLRVYAIDDSPVTVRLTADHARRIADALDDQPFKVTIVRLTVAFPPFDRRETVRVCWVLTCMTCGAYLAGVLL